MLRWTVLLSLLAAAFCRFERELQRLEVDVGMLEEDDDVAVRQDVCKSNIKSKFEFDLGLVVQRTARKLQYDGDACTKELSTDFVSSMISTLCQEGDTEEPTLSWMQNKMFKALAKPMSYATMKELIEARPRRNLKGQLELDPNVEISNKCDGVDCENVDTEPQAYCFFYKLKHGECSNDDEKEEPPTVCTQIPKTAPKPDAGSVKEEEDPDTLTQRFFTWATDRLGFFDALDSADREQTDEFYREEQTIKDEMMKIASGYAAYLNCKWKHYISRHLGMSGCKKLNTRDEELVALMGEYSHRQDMQECTVLLREDVEPEMAGSKYCRMYKAIQDQVLQREKAKRNVSVFKRFHDILFGCQVEC